MRENQNNSRTVLKSLLPALLVVLALLLLPSYAGAQTAPGPTISVLSPAIGASLSKPSVLVLIQVWDSDGTATTPQISKDGGGFASDAGIVEDTNRSCGTSCKIYKYTWDISGYSDDTSHSVRFSSSDGANTGESRTISINVRAQKSGDGYLLARSFSSQFCLDCHSTIMAHSSQTTSKKYGNWETVCLDCHTSHSTSNIYLIQNAFIYNGFSNTVSFLNNSGDASNSYVDANAPTGTGGVFGICQVCHTKTGGATARWRRTGNASTHYAAPSSQRCTNCHEHVAGFTGGGACNGCHGYPPIAGDGKDVNTIDDGGKGAHWASLTNGAHIDNGLLDPEVDQYDASNTVCNRCHDLSNANNHMNDVVNVSINSALSFNGVSAPVYLGVPGNTGVAKTCSNVLCHFKETPRWSCPPDE